MGSDEGLIKKYPVRFRVRGGLKGDEGLSLDESVVKHLEELRSLGGNAEWLRNAIREQYIREQNAKRAEVSND